MFTISKTEQNVFWRPATWGFDSAKYSTWDMFETVIKHFQKSWFVSQYSIGRRES